MEETSVGYSSAVTCELAKLGMDLTSLITGAICGLIGILAGVLINRFNVIYIAQHPVKKDEKKHGGDLVAEVLKAHGVECMFTLVGGHISPILVGAERLGIRVIDTRHEVSAVFAADAVARLSGKIGVAAVTAGPGLTNTVTAIKNAQMAESPVLLMGGAAANLWKGRGALQDIEQLKLFAPICKFTATVTSLRDIVPTLRKAIQIAQSGTPGPVFVEFPIDTLYPYEDVSEQLIVAVNRNKEQLWKNSDLFWKPSVAAECDVGTFICQLSASLAGFEFSCTADWVQKLRERDEVTGKKNIDMSEVPVDKFVNPMKLLFHLEEVLPPDSIIVVDGGDFVGTAAYILRQGPRKALGWLDPGAFGTLGVGGGFALGAKFCRPNSQVWIIYGDGSCGYSLAEVDTMKRHNLPCLAVIGNDGGWTQILREQVPRFQSSVACLLDHNDYHTVTNGYGGRGFCIKEKAEISTEIKEAMEWYEEKQVPVVINALIGKTSFREGSISV
ncbi:unnamed protein product [Darwinula stevensoni]|uniref:2-hydroxyacyl-CoA lyase 2 n=1 Tax=Darwinula stevensoni TaxID=69355 RepID=A0A7R8XB17_9CRUS|nr:unnamed protein product [Darwinula stevensoni]CAG0886017.1 unnamed protein product [Darwinula stevensoni]